MRKAAAKLKAKLSEFVLFSKSSNRWLSSKEAWLQRSPFYFAPLNKDNPWRSWRLELKK